MAPLGRDRRVRNRVGKPTSTRGLDGQGQLSAAIARSRSRPVLTDSKRVITSYRTGLDHIKGLRDCGIFSHADCA